MIRKEALSSIKENVENKNLLKHMLATEAVMRALARRLEGDEEEWGLTGLLHDVDVELTEEDMNSHSRLGGLTWPGDWSLARRRTGSEHYQYSLATASFSHITRRLTRGKVITGESFPSGAIVREC